MFRSCRLLHPELALGLETTEHRLWANQLDLAEQTTVVLVVLDVRQTLHCVHLDVLVSVPETRFVGVQKMVAESAIRSEQFLRVV